MSKLLSFPFRVPAFGAAVTVEQGSEPYYDEQIAVIILTERGERAMHPNLGIPDITFMGFQYSALSAQLADEMPEITDINITIVPIDDRTESVVVEYDLMQESQ